MPKCTKLFPVVNSLYILIILFSLNENIDSLQISGEWNTDKNFFKFLTKFGFQKTIPHDRKGSEGFIFGNITSISKNLVGKGINEGVFGTLALLPRQFFVDLYSNRTKANSDPDLACQLMFKSLSNEAYDSKCHDGGQEDFLRRVPCMSGKLCVDEDNADNVIPNTQLTYAIQDINNPRFWYLSLVACMWEREGNICRWRHIPEPIHLQYHLTIVNGNPETANHNPFEYHFSFDKQDTVEIFLVCVVYYGFILVPLQIYAACRQVHAITRLFTCTLVVQMAGLLFNTLHLLVFCSDGIGFQPINIIGDLLNILAQSIFMLVLLVLAKGWAVTRLVLSSRPIIMAIWALYSILILTLYFWNMMEVDVIEDIDEYQTWPGCVTLVLRVIIMLWFLSELRTTMTYEHNTNKIHFFLHFGAGSLVWFIYLPVVALIALQVSPLWRYKLLLGFTYSADLLAHSFMTYLLWPERTEQYLLLAYEADLSAELDEFDEALHVLNRHSDNFTDIQHTYDDFTNFTNNENTNINGFNNTNFNHINGTIHTNNTNLNNVNGGHVNCKNHGLDGFQISNTSTIGSQNNSNISTIGSQNNSNTNTIGSQNNSNSNIGSQNNSNSNIGSQNNSNLNSICSPLNFNSNFVGNSNLNSVSHPSISNPNNLINFSTEFQRNDFPVNFSNNFQPSNTQHSSNINNSDSSLIFGNLDTDQLILNT